MYVSLTGGVSDSGPLLASSSARCSSGGFFVWLFSKTDTFQFDVALPMTNYSQRGFKKNVFPTCCWGKKPLKYSTKTPAPSLLIRPPLKNSLMKVPPRPSFLTPAAGAWRRSLSSVQRGSSLAGASQPLFKEI